MHGSESIAMPPETTAATAIGPDSGPRLSLLGGPLHRIGARVGLVRNHTNTLPLGLALGIAAWAVLILLALVHGVADKLLSLAFIGVHVRLLVVIPLFFACEAQVDPRMTAFVRTLQRSQVVPPGAVPALAAEIARIGRWRDSWIPEAVCLLLAVVLSLAGPLLALPGSSGAYDPARGEPVLVGLWYWGVCLTLFRFLVFRWLWRLALWCFFLWRLSRLELKLIPTHPDGVAGLGYLEVVHIEFATLIMAISTLASAAVAEGLIAGTGTKATLYSMLALMVAVEVPLFLGPMCVFAAKLRAARAAGIEAYMQFATRYVSDFERTWIGADAAPTASPLGTADLQSLADLGTSVSVVREMQLMPFSHRLLVAYVTAAALPLLPLLLFEYPIAELSEKLFKLVLGV